MAVIITLNPLIIIVLFLMIISSSYINNAAIKKSRVIDLETAPVIRLSDYLSQTTIDIQIGKEIRAFSLHKYFSQKITSVIKNELVFVKKKNKLLIKGGVFSTVLNIMQTGGLYAYMAFRFIAGAITIGDFSMFLGVVAHFTSSISMITDCYFKIQSQNEILNRYLEYHDLPEKLRNGAKDINLPLTKNVSVEFRNVWFKYPNMAGYVLEDISFKVNAGQKVSIIGENGAGKTTMVKLLCRLYDPEKGEILVNGINIKTIPYDQYMDLIGTIFQDFQLFAYSVRENLDPNNKASDETINEILKKCDIFDKINTMKDGLNSILLKRQGIDGYELSGGKSQKLAIARAYIKNSPILILDEPTAAT